MDDDQALVNRTLKGDKAAFDALVEEYMRPAYCYCKKMLGSHQDAEDVSQNAFLKAYKMLPSFEGRSSFKTWLYRILTNECLNHIKSRNTRGAGSLSTMDNEVAVTDSIPLYISADSANSLQAKVRENIELLPERQKAALTLHYYQDMDHSEIAEVLSCSYDNVKSLISQARKTLWNNMKDALNQKGVSHEEL